MDKYLVKINKDSIKENPNAGSTTTRINMGQTISFKAETLPDDFIDGKNCAIFEWEENDGVKTNIVGEIFDPMLLDKCVNERCKGISINIKSKNTSFNHAPIPAYSFDYENTKIKCNECGEEIMTDDLKSEESSDGEYYSDRICPKCGMFDCCDLEYEKIGDVLKLINK
jgi:predicted RNA-binding Zn-ribbon protein involved in translation (DUF1610 family)